MKPQARLISLGSYLPKKVVHNRDLEKIVDTTDDWIQTRTGIVERRKAAPKEAASDLGTKAARKALRKAHLNAKDIDLILVATMTPDHFMPSTAALIQAQLGASRAAAFDVSAACSGFLYALATAKAFIEAGQYKCVLLVATEKMSAFLDYTDRSTCVLFGDGASAAVITADAPGFSIDAITLGTDGSAAACLQIPAGGSRAPRPTDPRDATIKMQGREVFKHAVRRMEEASKACLKAASLTSSDLSWVIPHQANRRIIEALAKKLHIPFNRVFINLDRLGNTSAASVGLALDALTNEERIVEGEHLLLLAFGGGLTWGGAVLTKRGKTT